MQRPFFWCSLMTTAFLFCFSSLSGQSKTSYEPEMVFVEGGTFQMGSNDGDDDERPVHSVTLSSYSIGKYEVTQAQWREVMGTNPSYFKNCDECPVENVSWNDMQDYIQKLNAKTGKNYRLPTEAEWEFSARGGKQSKGFTYSGSNTVTQVAWMGENAEGKTHPVGKKQANELGIYDMSGNAGEWCSDRWGAYKSASTMNPTGAKLGRWRVLRGSSGYSRNAWCCRTAYRRSLRRDFRDDDSGSRLVLSPSSPGQ